MNKFFNKIIGASLAIAMMVGVGVSVNIATNNKEMTVVNADSPATLSFGAACGGSGTDSDGNTWTVTSDAAESAYDSTKGVHYGTGSKAVSYLNLATSGITGTISQIVVQASGASGTSAKLNVTVGANAFGSEKSLTGSNDSYTLTGSASGEIIISITQASAKKALYCKSVSVTYSNNGGDVPPVTETCTVTFNYLNGSESTQVTVNKNATIADKMPADPTKDTDTEQQTKYSFGGWYKSDDPENISYVSGNKVTSGTVISADINVYAKWNATKYYIISFVANGGSAVENVTVDEGKKIATPVSAKDGCLLEGWYTTENFEEDTKVDFYNDTFTKNTVLYAKWTQIAIQEGGVFIKVTKAEDVTDGGKYLIVYESEGTFKAFDGNAETLDAASNYVNATLKEGKYIAKDNNTASAYFTITTKEGHKYIRAARGAYIGRSANSNGLESPATQSADVQNTISFEENGDVVITGKAGAVLRYNSASGQYRFRYFKSDSYSKQQPIQLYKFVSANELVAALDTQTSLAYNYHKDDEGNFTYSNIVMRFGGKVSKDLWTDIDNITGFGVVIMDGEAAKTEEEAAILMADKVSSTVSTDLAANYAIDYFVPVSNMAVMGQDDDNYFWNLRVSVDEANIGTFYTAFAYIKVGDEYIYMNMARESIGSLANDYIKNRGYNASDYDGSLQGLVEAGAL